MQKKLLKPIFSFALAFVMAASLFVGFIPTTASAVTQSEINDLKSQKAALSEQSASYEATISSLKNKKNAQVELKTALDSKLALTNQQIMNLEEQIKLHDALIERKTQEVGEAQVTADEQLEKYKKRVRAMEESGRYNYVEVLFGANSIGEFLSLIDDIGDIMKSDKELEDSYKESVVNLKEAKAEYEEVQTELKQNKVECAQLKDQLQVDITQAAAVITSLQADINENASVLSELDSQESALQSQIQAKVNQLNEQKKAEEEANRNNNNGGSSGGSTTGTGNLVWPSYCTYISSRQGPRVHPITGEYKNHGGTDIAASYGSAIYAADSGRVVSSSDGWNGGWGNYVMIDHGNGMQTLYAHMSSRAVSVGQTVSRGQTIGYVGSTGMSTGPHLHFEMYVNGSRIDPQTKYPGMSFTYSPSA
ncbi:MAG: peptidoglycan DD-metalloendopeptidase family protein [Firmicutes bacterium]|nr:peptidoglycan DD-metalloendopeptidase family protein [Bacillota bacterium]